MAWELHAYKIDQDGRIRVKHIFYGETTEEADQNFQQHAHSCPKFGPAVNQGDVISIFHEVDELPTPASAQDEADEADDA